MNKEKFTNKVLDAETTLYRVSMSMLKNEKDCEDAVQDAILIAYERLSTLKNEDYFTTWLIRILINVCIKQIKKRKKIYQSESMIDIGENDDYSNIEIKEIFEKLPLKIRTVIMLYYGEQFSVKEIKDILHIPEGTVKSRLAKGRKLLKFELE
ncbi:MAG: sigma-70 family RNA polymerase sigma factor [Ruminococcus sp.]|nr:sigma-70 family RNA polymerase sigma factor [Ruminococcus sp.]